MKHFSIGEGAVSNIDPEHDCITYDTKIQSLTIFYSNYQQKEKKRKDLFRFLEEHKIIDASELGSGELVCMGWVFKFSDLHEDILIHTGKVTLRFSGKLKDYVSPVEHQEFIYKYYKVKYLKVLPEKLNIE